METSLMVGLGMTGPQSVDRVVVTPDNWKDLRHDVRNLLNAIKLSCAVLQRHHPTDNLTRESFRDIDKAVDDINHLITQFTMNQPRGLE